MKFFRRKLKRVDLIRFDYDLAKLLENDLPLYKQTLELSRVDGIALTKKPNTITIGRIFNSELYKTIKDKFVKNFDLEGVLIWNRNTRKYEPIRLRFHFDALSQIFLEDPMNFRDNFNLKKILIQNLTKKELDSLD